MGAALELTPTVLWRQLKTLASRNQLLGSLGIHIERTNLDQEICAGLSSLGWYIDLDHEIFSHAARSFRFSLGEVLTRTWNRISHELRETWRACVYQRLQASFRHEIMHFPVPQYSSERITLLKKWIQSNGYALALATGPIQSPAHNWTCILNVDIPKDVLLFRFGWPRSREDFPLCDKLLAAVLSWYSGDLFGATMGSLGHVLEKH